jgi:hypothetical protein
MCFPKAWPLTLYAFFFLNTFPWYWFTFIISKGLRDIGQLKPGETLVVSGAAGSVGSLACQLGKRGGAKVIAIAGSQDKCEWLEKELGVDKALNYKSPGFYEDFRKVGYLDVFFDNVGGESFRGRLNDVNTNAQRQARSSTWRWRGSTRMPGLCCVVCRILFVLVMILTHIVSHRCYLGL